MRPTLEKLLQIAPVDEAVVTPRHFRATGECAPIFPHDKAKWRLALYLALAVLDGAVIAGVHALYAPGHQPTLDRYLLLELAGYVLIAVRLHGIGLLALRHPYEGATRAAVAAASAPLAVALLALAFASRDMLPPAFARETLTVTGLLFFIRRQLAVTAGWLTAGRFTNDLVLIDDDEPRSFSRRFAVRARDIGIAPVAADPAMLDRIGRLLQHCDRVIIATPAPRRSDWLDTLRGIDMDVEFLAPEYHDRRPFALRSVDGDATLLMRRAALPPASRVQKRVFDIVVAGVALVLLSPVMALLMLAIRRESPGPVFFRQARVGRGNRQFTVFKFRTMRHDAIDLTGIRSASCDDDRVTRLGRFMRGTSLDELPQLLNVLAGDMSIVGPRPHALGSRAGGALFWDVDAAYWERHAIKPGMTGLAQVRGFRGATDTSDDIARRLRADIEYLTRWSLLKDLFIMLRTVRVLVHAKAY